MFVDGRFEFHGCKKFPQFFGFAEGTDSILETVQEAVTIAATRFYSWAQWNVTKKILIELLHLVLGLHKIAPWVNCPYAPQAWPFTLQLFLDFCAIFFPDGPQIFCSARFTEGHPTQSIMYVPLQVNRFQNSLLIIQQTCSESYSGDFNPLESDSPHKIMRFGEKNCTKIEK